MNRAVNDVLVIDGDREWRLVLRGYRSYRSMTYNLNTITSRIVIGVFCILLIWLATESIALNGLIYTWAASVWVALGWVARVPYWENSSHWDVSQ